MGIVNSLSCTGCKHEMIKETANLDISLTLKASPNEYFKNLTLEKDKKRLGLLTTTRKPLDLKDINTLFLEDHQGMDPLEEDQLDEELMMEEGRDEEEEAIPDEPKPSTSTVNMATTDADHAQSLPLYTSSQRTGLLVIRQVWQDTI
ncbi:hypothetical protein EOD39_14786 [Acipenser ruthenus]|uniref:Uncharacterized protein n=1 Tax=Acipenser ruthenus TaxID=7906 RepID=A0A444UET3_ACIRT|nr:hypothetical protein EOD39_14786 [Acipenser ruthenus]